jgi:hypothetical protein
VDRVYQGPACAVLRDVAATYRLAALIVAALKMDRGEAAPASGHGSIFLRTARDEATQ